MQKLLEKLENLEDELLSNTAFILCDTEEECNAVIERLKSEYRDLLILDKRGIIS